MGYIPPKLDQLEISYCQEDCDLKEELEKAKELLRYVLTPAFYAKGRTKRDEPIRDFLGV